MEVIIRMKKILLVDGHGLAFRGFYALPEMNAPDGTPTNAVLGFTNMLLKALEEWQPDGVGLFFDPHGPTARNKMYEAYKEGRAPTPEAFKAQMPLILDLSQALGFPLFVEDGVEADDLIAATAVSLEEEGVQAIILSADKDLLQILRGNVRMARPSKGISEFKFYDADSFKAEYGFEPKAMADYLALVGDAADNIPGVAGIGDKTARTLLSEYGSLDGVYEHLDALPKGQRVKLENGREAARASYGLVVPQPVEPIPASKLERKEIDYPNALALTQRLGLKKLVQRLELDRPAGAAMPSKASVVSVDAEASELSGLLEENVLVLANDPPTLMTMAGKWATLGELGKCKTEERVLRDWLRASERRLVLADYGSWCGRCEFLASLPEKIFDAELAHYFYHPDAKSHTLEAIIDEPPSGGAAEAKAILALYEEYGRSGLSGDMESIMREIDAPLTPVLLRLGENGLHVDLTALRELDGELKSYTSALEREICTAAGRAINLNSPKQVGELLFETLRLPAVKKTKTGYSTDVTVLEELARLPEPLSHIPKKMLDYRECSKMSSGFVQPFLAHAAQSADGKIHSTFLHTVTGTGRLASRDPNVQNLPVFGDWAVKFRSTVTPGGTAGEKIFVAADYSQIELRVLAHLSGEERLTEAFAKGRDIHLETASWVFDLDPADIMPEQRRFAKTVNFGLLYGMGAHGLAQRMGISRQEAAKLVERYFSVLPKVKGYLEKSAADARARGYTRSIFGRIRPLSEVATVEGRGNNPIERVAVNTPIQSAAADIAKIALIRFQRALEAEGCESRLVLQVHDSLICETPVGQADRVEALLAETMEGVRYIDVPLKAEPKRGRSLAEV